MHNTSLLRALPTREIGFLVEKTLEVLRYTEERSRVVSNGSESLLLFYFFFVKIFRLFFFFFCFIFTQPPE